MPKKINPENDKIEYYRILHRFKYDEKKVHVLLNFRKKLTPTGFEEYVRKFFELKGYVTERIGGFNDEKIDVRGIKNRGEIDEQGIFVQCKKYTTGDVSETEVASYAGMINNKRKEKPNTLAYYITTGIYTGRARKFCVENQIIAKNENDILKMNEEYSYEKFEYDMLSENLKNDKFFTSEQLTLFEINNNLTNSQFFKLLKKIKRDYIYVDQIKKEDYLLNKTLTYLSKQSDNYFKIIENIILDVNISQKEKGKIFRLGEHFIKIFQQINIVDGINESKEVLRHDSFSNEATLKTKLSENENITFIDLLLSFFKVKRIEGGNIKRSNINTKKTIINNSKDILKNELKEYRLNISRGTKKPAYVIFQNTTLEEICNVVPHSKNELLQIKGIGLNRYNQYGEDILNITANY
ncbi:MAG: restriction endonuclease [Candidatus Gracilibacteria bacterium]